MKRILRLFSPKRAATDFVEHWQQPTPHRWPILGVALALTFCVFMLFVPKSERIDFKKPDVTFISTFAPDRSEAEIIASNCANQILMDRIRARIEERAEFRKEIYRELGRATFVDVDELDEQIAKDEAEELAANAAAGIEPEDEEALLAEQQLSLEEYCSRAEG